MQNKRIYKYFSMYLKSIDISNFRNIKKMSLMFNKNINIFIGKNAQGKTSILESIYVLAFTKSCKSNSEDELITIGKNYFRLKGSMKNGNLTKKLEVFYEKGDKITKINNKNVCRVCDYVSNMNVIMFSPDDLDIVKKSPSLRRNFINIELCQLYREYLNVLNEYNKILKMRNDYIRKNYLNINYNYLDVITTSLIERILVIYKYREEFFNNINSYIREVFYKLTKFDGLEIVYKKNINFASREEIFNFFKDNYMDDIEKGSTIYGPHRDDFIFSLLGKDLKLYGSQGLQRLAILAFKLAEINLFKEVKGNYPIVLLDDIFSEIDLDKRKNLLRFIKNNIQFIITTTDINNISSKILDKATIFTVSDGVIRKRSEKSE